MYYLYLSHCYNCKIIKEMRLKNTSLNTATCVQGDRAINLSDC